MTTKCKSAIIWQLEVRQKVYLRSVSFWVESLGSLTYRITSSAKRYTLTSFPMCVSLSSFVFLFQLRLQALYWLERAGPLVLFLETGSLIVLVLGGLGISLDWLARQPQRATWISFPSHEIANTRYEIMLFRCVPGIKPESSLVQQVH